MFNVEQSLKRLKTGYIDLYYVSIRNIVEIGLIAMNVIHFVIIKHKIIIILLYYYYYY